MSKVLVAIPIINERNNIVFLLRKILSIRNNISVLYIDDNSNDGSDKLLKKIKSKNKNIYYLYRNRRLGIGSAHKEAIKFSFLNNFDYLITIDGDCTHDPIYIDQILKKLDNYDVVNTSRFINNNSLNGWSVGRTSLTRLRYLITKLLLKSNFDSSSGYRGYNLKKICKDHLLLSSNNNYFFLIESLLFLEKLKYKIFEISNVLNPRKAGVSKLNLEHLLDAFFSLIKLYFKLKKNGKNEKNLFL